VGTGATYSAAMGREGMMIALKWDVHGIGWTKGMDDLARTSTLLRAQLAE